MKRMLIAGTLAVAAGGQAFAADLPQPQVPRAPATYVPVTEPVFFWGGFYFGINGGYGFGSSDFTGPGVSGGAVDTSGFLVGSTLGANWQAGAFVFGVEGDLDWADLSGSTACTLSTSKATTCETKSNYLGTARARAGWAWDRILFYGTGGAAFGNIKSGTAATGAFDNSDEFGWTAGAGIEAAFAPNWTAKVEYLYVDLGNGSCSGACFGTAAPVTVSLKENVARLGVNYKFGW